MPIDEAGEVPHELWEKLKTYKGSSLAVYHARKYAAMKGTLRGTLRDFWNYCKSFSKACVFCAFSLLFLMLSLLLCWLAAGMYLDSHKRSIEIVHPVLEVSDPRWVKGI